MGARQIAEKSGAAGIAVIGSVAPGSFSRACRESVTR